MIRKILKKDLCRNKIITISLFIFILLSALLTASSISIFAKLSSSVDSFFQHTAIPDFVQMHAGEFQQSDIDTFVSKHKKLVKDQQTVTLLNIKGADIYFNQKAESEESSVMDAAFVKQNQKFDFLINEKNEAVQLKPGEAAVPVYYQQRDNLKKNDVLYVNCNGVRKEYKIVDFIKDSQMNASIISSKRLLVSDSDYNDLKAYAQPEYLIEFLSDDVSALEIAYQNSSLPHNGTTITQGLLLILNSLMDGIIAAVLLAIALLLMGIAFLCLRFTILMTLEEDVKEIGIMKAVGIAKKDIQRLYLGKYAALTLLGCLSGYICSFFMQSIVFQNIQLYMGTGPVTIWIYVLPAFAVCLLGLLILGFCKLILNKMHRITPLQALQSGVVQNQPQKSRYISLRHHGNMPVSLFVSIQDLWTRKRLYLSVFFVVMLSSFLMIVPFNFQSTLESKSFIRYMGVGDSDLRMDVFFDEGKDTEYQKTEKTLKQDPEVDIFAAYTTYKADMKNREGEWEDLQVETGDFKKFPLTYLSGNAPSKKHEIAVSYSISREQDLKLDDTIEIQGKDSIEKMKVCGIYQDITNGGKSAKLASKPAGASLLRRTINVNFKPGTNLSKKRVSYSEQFSGVKVTDTQGYVSQTLSGLNKQVHLVVRIALILAFLITIFQISLFLKMLLKRDEGENTIMKCIGFTNGQIQLQYLCRMLITAVVGIAAGTLAANTGGESIISLCMKSMGITRLQFTIIPWMTYFILPLFLLSGVVIAAVLAVRKIGDLHIADLNRE